MQLWRFVYTAAYMLLIIMISVVVQRLKDRFIFFLSIPIDMILYTNKVFTYSSVVYYFQTIVVTRRCYFVMEECNDERFQSVTIRYSIEYCRQPQYKCKTFLIFSKRHLKYIGLPTFTAYVRIRKYLCVYKICMQWTLLFPFGCVQTFRLKAK